MIRAISKRSTRAIPPGPRRIERRLAAILGVDVVGYSLLMARAEEDTHRRVGAELDHLVAVFERGHGRIFSFAGDSLMAEFPSSVAALKAALRVQADAARRNAALPPEQRIIFRIGINAGEVVVQQQRTGGNTVNVAARLEALAEPGGIALSEAVLHQVREVVSVGYVYFGEPPLKNIRNPVRVYAIPAAECLGWAGMPALPRLTGASVPAQSGMDYRASLAVLPFRTLQKDQSDAYFAEGIVDDIIHALGGLADLLVIARSSTQTFARAPLDLRRVGHELDVRYALSGTVRIARGKLRITVELSETQSGTVIWIDRFDGAMADLFDLQDRIAMRVATSVAPNLRERELDRALRKHPDSLTAYDLTLQAQDLFHRADRRSLQACRDLLERAIAADPGYGPVYSHLAALHMRVVAQGWSTDEMADRAAAADLAREAIMREPNDAVALAIHGHIQSYLLKNFDIARSYLNRALDAGPSCPLAWAYSSLTSGYLGDHDTAIQHAERALRLSPIGPDSFRFESYLAQAYYLADRFQDAVAWARMAAARVPTFTTNMLCLTASLVAVGETDAARVRAEALMQMVPTFRLSMFRARTPLPPKAAARVAERLQRAGVPD